MMLLIIVFTIGYFSLLVCCVTYAYCHDREYAALANAWREERTRGNNMEDDIASLKDRVQFLEERTQKLEQESEERYSSQKLDIWIASLQGR